MESLTALGIAGTPGFRARFRPAIRRLAAADRGPLPSLPEALCPGEGRTPDRRCAVELGAAVLAVALFAVHIKQVVPTAVAGPTILSAASR